MKTALFIIAHQGFQDTEYSAPRKLLEDAGVEVTVASSIKGKCTGKFGGETEAKYTIEEVSAGDYDVVIFIGGPGVMPEYQGNEKYLQLAKEAKVLAAICIAPTVISDSGIFKGKRITGWDSGGEQKAHIENNGGIFTSENVTQDGNIITANGPNSAEAFGMKILETLS